MKTSIGCLAALISAISAFPHLADRNPTVPHASPEMQLRARQMSATEGNCGPTDCTTFNEAEQFVDVRPGSAHQYVKPSASDIREPCPGLNAAANHGFIPHNGIPNIVQTIEGLAQAYGMGPDLSGFLAAYAVVMDGDVLSETWSIGGPYPGSLPSLLVGEPQGISYSHNNYEGDSSACRADAYINGGDAHSLILSKFEHLYNIADSYTLDNLRAQNLYNQQLSESTNPYYFSGPFTGLIVAPAAHNFIINFMSNHSADNPNGYLDKEQLKTFFGVSGPDKNLVWNKGQEQIPQEWYRRPSANPYTITAANSDLRTGYQMYPQTFRVGGNTGKVNSFVGVDLQGLTGGTYSYESLLQGTNLFCFAIQTLQVGLPGALSGILNDITSALNLFNWYTAPVLANLNCPPLAAYNQGLLNPFPGFSYHPSGPATNYKE